jgi:exonuclease SbcD
MITFIHTADIHYGVENYGRVDPKTGIHSRLLDFDRAFNFCIDAAIERKVDFFLFSGDAYKTPHPSQTQQKLLIESFFRLYDAKIPAIIVVGNHDHPLSFGKANALDIFSTLPVDGFHVVSKPTTIHLETKNGPINVVGIPWPTRNTVSIAEKHLHKTAHEITSYISKAIAHIIKDQAAALDPQVPAVLAGHLTVSNGIFSGSEKRAIFGTDPILLPSQLAIEPFDYVALGHLHRYQDLNKNGYPSVVYAGSIERVDFGERKEAKGFCLVSIPKKGTCSHEFIKTPTRDFIQIEVKLKENEAQTEQVLAAIAKHSIADAVLKVVYHIPVGRQDAVDLKLVHRACASAMYVVGIIPIRPVETRERRFGAVKMDMDLQSLLSAYFDTKPELKERKKDLIEKTLLLAQELQDQDSEEQEAE